MKRAVWLAVVERWLVEAAFDLCTGRAVVGLVLCEGETPARGGGGKRTKKE